jgi:hypothetical protein
LLPLEKAQVIQAEIESKQESDKEARDLAHASKA